MQHSIANLHANRPVGGLVFAGVAYLLAIAALVTAVQQALTGDPVKAIVVGVVTIPIMVLMGR